MRNINRQKSMYGKRGKMKGLAIGVFFVLSLMLFTIQFVSAINEFDEYKPYLHSPSVGNVPKLQTFGEYETELFPGAGTYRYYIEVPQGVIGLQPSISLSYSSQSALQRPGVLGAGWTLTEGHIMRHVNYTLDDISDDYFVLTLNNNRLRMFYNGADWNTEINPNQLKIDNLTNIGEEYWLAATTDGTKYRFGFNGDSLLESNTGRDYNVKWSLDLIEDVQGNKVFYGYDKNLSVEDKGTLYLANITYNNDQLKLIDFDYEEQARPDRRFVYEQGNELDESRRLSDISVFFNNSLVRRYNLKYDNLNDDKSLSALANITYIGSDNSSILNTIKLEYYQTKQGFDNTTNTWIVPESLAFSSKDATKKDFGVRLLDVNNDGFSDLIKVKEGESHTTKLNNKGDGWNDSSVLVVPVGIDLVDTNSVDQGVRFADVDSDGLVDILKAKAGSTRQVYLNNGTTWNEASSIWSVPVDFITSDNKDLGVMLVDFNGDGKVDVLKALAPSTKEAYVNNGTGWQNISGWDAPDFFVTSDNEDNGLRIVELNNDGLPDLILGGNPGNAWFNNGSGWTEHSEYAPDLEFEDHANSRPDLGVRLMELNGDGLIDIVQNFLSNVSIINQTCVGQGNTTEECVTGQNITFDTNTKINNGSGWIAGMGWLSPEKFTDEGFNIGRRIADVNGDEFSDIVVAYEGPPAESVTHIKNATSVFLLKKVTNTYGGITEVSYIQSTLSENTGNLGFNIWVVGNTSLNNSVGQGFEAGSEYSYLYVDGKFDYGNLEFRGFGLVNETLPDNSIRAHFFLQDSVMKGKESRTTIYGLSGELVRDEISYFTHDSDGMIFLNGTSVKVYDGAGSPITENISFEYDLYGNIKEINSLGDVDVMGDEKLEIFDYIYNTTNYVVNKPRNYTLFDASGINVVKRVFYSYDNQTDEIGFGDLTKVESFNDQGQNPATQYIYDSFGNVIAEIEPLGSTASFGYDPTGAFRLNETNELGHIINYNYNLGTGNLLSETRDGLSKEYEYDIFGRITKEAISPDTINSPTKNYTYNLEGVAPEMIKLETKNSVGDYSEVIFVYDGLANLIQTRTLFDSGDQIVKNYFYDSKYRIDEEQNPYFDTYSASLNSPLGGAKIRYIYDSLDRVVNLTKQDNNSITINFDRSTITQFDENNNQIDYIIDAYDRIKTVKEYNRTDIFNTAYAYRADDNLINITDAKGNLFIFGYDTLGKRTSYDDPNMNIWTYSYDLNGNLINQTDGRNITTYLTYDPLNRLTLKRAGNSNVTFVYDGQYNGTLTNATTDSDYFNVVYNKYTYNGRLRVSREDVFYCYREVGEPGGPNDECEWVNVSHDYDSQNRIITRYFPNTDITSAYNLIGKLDKISGFLDSINYNAFGSIMNKTYTNKLVMNIDYDELNRISQLQTDSLQNLSYTYDNVGNVESINDTKNSKSYTMEYDALNRLITTGIFDSFASNSENFSYSYNPVGNFISKSSNIKTINFSYGELAHAPTNLSIVSTDCGTIDIPGTVLILQSDLSAGQTCFTIEANNVTIDGGGHTISYADVIDGYGVYSSGYSDLVIKNLNIKNNRISSVNSTAIYLMNGANNIVYNNNLTILGEISLNSDNYGIYLYNINNSIVDNNIVNTTSRTGNGVVIQANSSNGRSINNTISNNKIYTYERRSDGIQLRGTNNGVVNDTFIIGNSIETLDSLSNGIFASGGTLEDYGKVNISRAVILTKGSESNGIYLTLMKDLWVVSDSNISSTNYHDINLASGNDNDYFFTNVSYNDEFVFSGKLVREWYLKAKVNDTGGDNLNQANVSVFNVSGNIQFSVLTDSNGLTILQKLIQYVNDSGTTIDYNNYTINVTKSGYVSSSQTLNLDDNKDLVFTLSKIANDTNKFFVRNSSGSNVAWFGDLGNIVLKGNFTSGSECTSPDDNFLIKNSTSNTISYVDNSGNMCSKGSKSEEQINCTTPTDFVRVLNSSNSEVIVINSESGDLCLTGSIYENSNP